MDIKEVKAYIVVEEDKFYFFIRFWGGSHATNAGDFAMYSGTVGNIFYLLDESADRHRWYAPGGTSIMTLDASTGLAVNNVVKTLSTTAASLPSAATVGAGARAFVTDANATTFLSTVAGGGANAVPVVSDGTNWLIG